MNLNVLDSLFSAMAKVLLYTATGGHGHSYVFAIDVWRAAGWGNLMYMKGINLIGIGRILECKQREIWSFSYLLGSKKPRKSDRKNKFAF